MTMGFFPRDTVNSFTALERNVVPGHNLILPAIPTCLLGPLFHWGNQRKWESWSHRFLFDALPSLWQEESEVRILDFLQGRAQKRSSAFLSPTSPFELSRSRLGTITPKSHFQHQNTCTYTMCRSKYQAFQKESHLLPVCTQP